MAAANQAIRPTRLFWCPASQCFWMNLVAIFAMYILERNDLQRIPPIKLTE